jgi:glycosyltransferase involved in cell wall biosynthesis
MQPSISVIIPTYNRSGVLRYSVDSVLNQPYPVSEVIIVDDDGSTDNTAAFIEQEMRDKSSWRARVRYGVSWKHTLAAVLCEVWLVCLLQVLEFVRNTC